MLLLFRSSGATEGTAGISFGVSGSVTATALAALTFGVPAPASAELNVSGVAAITLGANGNNIPVSPAAGTVSHLIGVTGVGGYALTGAVSTVFDVSGTVGTFFDGQGTATTTFDVVGATYPFTSASTAIAFDLSGFPDVSGGVVETAALAHIAFDISAASALATSSAADLLFGLTATGTANVGLNPDSQVLDKRPRTTLRSFLIGS